MKKIICMILVVCVCNTTIGQWLTQSAEGKGSFLFKGANVAVDLAKTDLSFTINNLNSPYRVSKAKDNLFLFYGGGVNAKNEEGLGNLFSAGEFVPSANANGYLGIRFSNSYDSLYKKQERLLSDALQQITQNQQLEFITKMEKSIDFEIDGSSLDETDDADLIKKLKKDWKEKLAKLATQPFSKYLKSYLSKNPGLTKVATIANIIDELLNEIKLIVKSNDIELGNLTQQLILNRDEFVKKSFWRLSIFTFGGIDASSFKRVEDINTTSLSKSFIKEEYRGGNLGIGINYQIKQWKFGAIYSYKKTNNFNLLDKTDYKLTTTTTTGNQTLTQEKAISAYSGNYGEVEINELNLDALFTVGLGEKSESYAMLNAYLRGNFFSRDKILLPTSYNIGLGSYFFTKKSKFLGGLYVELPDVKDSFEKSKPVADQNIRPALKRLTFGIIAKVSLNSLISWQ